MHVLPLSSSLLHPGDDLAGALRAADIRDGDILIVSSKALATVEDRIVDLSTLTISGEAKTEAKNTGRSAAFCQAVLDETARMHGRVLGRCQGALLCEVTPDGLAHGSIMTANAGMDESNVVVGHAVGWPEDSAKSAQQLRTALEKDIAVIVTDSCCIPRRVGVTAYALACSGIDPVRSDIGKSDLYGRTLRVTQEAIADQLAVIGNAVMGNAAQATPAAIIRDHGIPFSAYSGWVPAFPHEEDLFRDLFRA